MASKGASEKMNKVNEQYVEVARQSVTSEEVHCWYCIGIESHGIATVKTVTDEYGHELGAYDTPYNYCPNCGRKIKED